MKTLYESLLDDFEKLEASTNPINEIKQFLKDNYLYANKLKISKEPNKDGYYEVDCKKCPSVCVKDGNETITSLTNGLFEFINVGSFNCIGCNKLTSLKGAPKEIEGNFNCAGCNKLVTLKGAPKKVGGGFACSGCNNLTSLKGAPKEIGSDFNCTNCNKLTSLEGAPEKVGGNFACSGCNNLTSLEGAPKEVGGKFDCVCRAISFTEQDVKDVCDVKGDIRTDIRM